jgi:hypothetical protein
MDTRTNSIWRNSGYVWNFVKSYSTSIRALALNTNTTPTAISVTATHAAIFPIVLLLIAILPCRLSVNPDKNQSEKNVYVFRAQATAQGAV